MNNILFILIFGLSALIFFLFWQNKKLKTIKGAGESDIATRWIENTQNELKDIKKVLQESLDKNRESLQGRLDITNKAIDERLDNAARVIGMVGKELGEVKEVGRQMKDLQDFLRSPKLRGNIGEQVLRDLLGQYLPKENVSFQYQFKEGQTVDAIIKTKEGIIPIDSKFPMENFKKAMQAKNEEEKNYFLHEFLKDSRKHIKSISRKYILPGEGTVDFAVMYVPSEAIWYEIIMSDEDVNSYAAQNKVYLVSPNNFFYFIKLVWMALQREKINKSAKKVLVLLESIRQDSRKFGENLGVLDRHITNAKKSMEGISNQYGRLSSKIEKANLLKVSPSVSKISNK